jgi:hypothetical protein
MADDKNKSVAVVEDHQNFNLDPMEIFKSHISVIDNIRSEVNIEKNKSSLTKDLITKSFNGAPILGSFPAENSVQESRCHAFYRAIGFPVISKDLEIYNPGHDIIVDPTRVVTAAKKSAIATNPLPGFNDISDLRESNYKDWETLFSNEQSISPGIHALSLVNFRPFASSLQDQNGIEEKFNKENQKYVIADQGKVGLNNVKYSEYVNENGSEFGDNFKKDRYHLIKPFAVDARIDITTPGNKKIAVPFVLDADNLRVGPDLNADIPFLEYIILERFLIEKGQGAAENNSYVKDTLNQIKNIDSIKNKQIIADVASGQGYKQNQQEYFIFYFNIILNMITALKKAIIAVEKVQSKYFYLPRVNTIGPEGGCYSRDPFHVIFSEELTNLQTAQDELVTNADYKALYTRLSAKYSGNTSLPNLDSFKKIKFPILFAKTSVTQEQIGSVQEEVLDELFKRRSDEMQKANQALQLIEIITGEFSGFGLCDMVAILGALYIIPIENLLGFLDPDSYTRAKKHPLLKNGVLPENNPSNIKDALNDLTKTVKNYYDIMDSLLLSNTTNKNTTTA